MSDAQDPFHHHPGLRDKITDPLTSFFRTFRIESILEQHPELEWIRGTLHTDAQRDENRHAALKDHPDEDLWVFAYGSLMWDPAFQFTDVRRAHVADHARRFILREILGGRGSKEAPGLMAALDKGDGCDGLLFRIARDAIEVETEILWRRELVAPSYIPTFVTATAGDQQFRALTFVADYTADQIHPDICRDEQIDCLVHGSGILGTSLSYLENIVAQFAVLGIEDTECIHLLAEAQAACAAE